MIEGIEDICASLSLKTGISREKLIEEAALLHNLAEISSLLENKFVLFGGTALNAFHFGKSQRLSFDIDIKAGNFGETLKLLKKKYPLKLKARKFYVLEGEHGVKIDLSTEYLKEKPGLIGPNSIFHLQGHPIYNFRVPVYSFETLFAEKTLALASRGTARDLYDVWVAMSMEYDEEAYLKKLIKRADKTRTDPRIIITSHHHVDTDMGKIDSMLPNLDGKRMYAEVQGFIKELFFEG
ncbi:nucleotidyl transferase AbiEii/AbiGii toxin family protein [Candidatus Micrarchaeota archaeon]|nr:nucleotidyl transferase AbiEii/AbiGii toxin family protein [Candidatus Micrarchaeota archaeon]